MNELAITVAIVLLPGIVAAAIADKITLHSPRWGSFKYGIYSFVFGVICYITLTAIVWVGSFFQWFLELVPQSAEGLAVWRFVADQTSTPKLSEVLAATVLSPVVAFSAAFAVNHKVFNKVASKLRVSRKYGDENLFSFFLNSDDIDWVYVRDSERGLTYEGRVLSYSENDDRQELVLVNVMVYSYEKSEKLYFVPSIYLSKDDGSFVIEAVPLEYLEESNEQETTK